MYHPTASISTKSKSNVFAMIYIASIFLLLTFCSCDDIIIRDTGGKGNQFGAKYKVTITTDPTNSRLVVESMGTRQLKSAVSPAEFTYSPKPGMPTVVSVSKEGYKTKKVRLTPEMDHLHVVLEKAPLMQFDYGGGGMGGGMGRPALEDIPGMGASSGDNVGDAQE